jgi:hypothetical protein
MKAIIVENTPSIMDGCAVDIGQPPETAAESDLGEIPCVRIAGARGETDAGTMPHANIEKAPR